MTTLNRRTLLQVLGGAAMSPYLRALPATAASKGAGVSASKALWASLYANSGSSAEFVSVARTMGLSNAAIQGVGGRTIGVRLALAASTEKAAEISGRALQPRPSSNAGISKVRRRIEQSFKDILSTDTQASPLDVDRNSQEQTEVATTVEISNLSEAKGECSPDRWPMAK